MPRLSGRTALVLGASRGIGRGIARHLAREGAEVAISARTLRRADIRVEAGAEVPLQSALEDTARDIAELGGRAHPLPCDLSDDRDIAALVESAHARLGRIDMLINSSQFGGGLDGAPWDRGMEFYDAQMAVTPRASYAVTRLVVPPMLARGDGLIVNVSSTGTVAEIYSIAYRMARAALDRMTQALAHDLDGTGVHAVSLWPAFIRTERVLAASRGAAAGIPSLAGVDLQAEANTPDSVGLGIAHIASDPDRARLSGKAFGMGEIAVRYGFSDLDGSVIRNPDSIARCGTGDGRLVPPLTDRRGLV